MSMCQTLQTLLVFLNSAADMLLDLSDLLQVQLTHTCFHWKRSQGFKCSFPVSR